MAQVGVGRFNDQLFHLFSKRGEDFGHVRQLKGKFTPTKKRIAAMHLNGNAQFLLQVF